MLLGEILNHCKLNHCKHSVLHCGPAQTAPMTLSLHVAGDDVRPDTT